MSICLVRLGNDADAAHSHTRTDRALVPARFCRNSPVFFPALRQLQITGTVVAARLLISVVRWATKAQVATYRGCSRLSSIIATRVSNSNVPPRVAFCLLYRFGPFRNGFRPRFPKLPCPTHSRTPATDVYQFKSEYESWGFLGNTWG